MEFNNNPISNLEIIAIEINEFLSSKSREWMLVGDKYYKNDNDINQRKQTRQTETGQVEETYKANNKLAHNKIKNLIDEKINYLLSKDYILTCEDETYIEKVKSILTKDFQYKLTGLGYEASNKGIGWLQVYIDEFGKFKTIIIPSEQCKPIWKDSAHTELDMMLRVYSQVVYEGHDKKEITRVEVYTSSSVEFFLFEEGKLIIDSETELKNGGPISHYKKGDEWRAWGKVPFIPFKNNRLEFPDLKFIKSLIDSYDLTRSETANFIQDTKNLIYVLKGYGGASLGEFMRDLNYFRAIKIDDSSEGGVDTLNPSMDITAIKEHSEQLKRDIVEDGQGINKEIDKFGAAPSGVALKFLYAGLDLKCNALEVEFKRSFESLMYFIGVYLNEAYLGSEEGVDIDIVFNRDITINENDAIDNCVKSIGLVSEETLVSNHPWTKDLEKELASIKKEKEANVINNPSEKIED